MAVPAAQDSQVAQVQSHRPAQQERASLAPGAPALPKRLALAKAAGVPDIEFISISFDPGFDTPGVLKAYAGSHQIDTTNFTLLTGPEPAIKDLLKQFGVLAEFQGDILKHTLSTILIDRDGKIRHRADGSQWDPEEFVAGMKK